jgi:hypothetical protein
VQSPKRKTIEKSFKILVREFSKTIELRNVEKYSKMLKKLFWANNF